MKVFFTKVMLLLLYNRIILVFGMENREGNVEKLTAVTRFPDLFELYKRMKAKEHHTEPDSALDVEVKKHICHVVFTSGFFRKKGEIPVDFDSVAHEIHSLAETDEYYKELVQNYVDEKLIKMDSSETLTFGEGLKVIAFTYTYPTEAVRVNPIEELFEFAFTCLTVERKKPTPPVIYFVSDIYNVQKDVSDVGHVAARFVFRKQRSHLDLIALAEEPAVAYSASEYDLENLYLQIRSFSKSTDNIAQDPLCGLSKSQQIRVCASVMNASYFDGVIEHLPHEDPQRFKGECRKRKVSFQSEEAEKKAEGTVYEEWMLACVVEPIIDDAAFIYYVSRAYASHYAIVYARHYLTRKRYVLNVSQNISPLIDECHNPPCASMQSLLERVRRAENTPVQ